MKSDKIFFGHPTQMGFRFRPQVANALKTLTEKVNDQSSIPISMTTIVELLILEAAKKPPTEVLRLITKDHA